MSPLLSLVASTTPSGEPTLRPDLDPAAVTPGTAGFLATLLVVVAVIFLIRDMVRRVRRVRYAAEVEQARAARRADAPLPDAGSTDRTTSATDLPGRSPGGRHGPGNR